VFKSLALADIRRPLNAKEVRAVLFVVPISGAGARTIPQNAKTAPVLIEIENAGAIAEKEPACDNFDIPKGNLRGAPPAPGDDVTTLRVSFYLVARKSLDKDLIASFTQALMSAHRDLLGELRILA
jgi:TRAP-type uncharacterized transport system substrate-binding protein